MLMRQKEGGFLFLPIPGGRKLKKLLGLLAFLVLAGTGGKYAGVAGCLSGITGVKAGDGQYQAEKRQPLRQRHGGPQRSGTAAGEAKGRSGEVRHEAAPAVPEDLSADYFIGLLREGPDGQGAAESARGSGSGK